ncbi:MAG: hypothetical protein GF411_05095 [Candidatus Lokiarchaeota archaeon]|nr:hypothetical protein [Candidatus Lokiarchaeota archaeon]
MVVANVHTPHKQCGESVLVRKPAIPLRWDFISRPHIALILYDYSSHHIVRYYLSERGEYSTSGKRTLQAASLGDFPEGTIIEVRFSSVMINLFRLEQIDGVPCWRWIGRCRGLHDFNLEAVNWLSLLSKEDIFVAC